MLTEQFGRVVLHSSYRVTSLTVDSGDCSSPFHEMHSQNYSNKASWCLGPCALEDTGAQILTPSLLRLGHLVQRSLQVSVHQFFDLTGILTAPVSQAVIRIK